MLVREGNKIIVNNKKKTTEKVNQKADMLLDRLKGIDSDLSKDKIKVIFDNYGDSVDVWVDSRSLGGKLRDFFKREENLDNICDLYFDPITKRWSIGKNDKLIKKQFTEDEVIAYIKSAYSDILGKANK